MIQLFFRFFAGMLLALLAASAIVYWLLRYPPGRPDGVELQAELQETGQILVRELAKTDRGKWGEVIERYSTQSRFNVSLTKLDETDWPDDIKATLAAGDPLVVTESEGGPMLSLRIPDTETIADIVPPEPLRDPYPLDILTAAIGATLVIGLFGGLLTIPVVRRLKSLESAARAFGQGNWNVRADDRYPDAIGDLALALNRMAAEIQQLLQEQQELLQAVAHEFRAPLSRLGFAAEIAADADTNESCIEAKDDMDEAIEDLRILVAEVLGYARLQPGAPLLTLQCVAVDPIVEQIVRNQQELNPDVEFVTNPGTVVPLRVLVDAAYFDRAVLNLVTNASRYAHSQVRLAWDKGGNEFWLTVDDDGIGIPTYQHRRIFEPFTRLDPSRSRISGGTGLGLAIVERISRKHKGTVTVEDSPLGGARFRLTWPLDIVANRGEKCSSANAQRC